MKERAYRIYVKGDSMSRYGAINGNGGIAGNLIHALIYWDLCNAISDYEKMYELNPELSWQVRDCRNKIIKQYTPQQ